MSFESLQATLAQNVPWLVFVNVLAQQLGLPIPVWPTLLFAGSVAAGGGDLALALLAAVLAAMLADRMWYLLGRSFGYKVLAVLCKVSINPGSCVTQAEQRFVRWGAPSLVLAKFIPGFSAVAAPVAGMVRMRPSCFTTAAASGAALWAGSALALGWLLREQVGQALTFAQEHAPTALLALALTVAIWLGGKLWRRARFRRLAAIPHVTAPDLIAALASPTPPRVLDFRSAGAVGESGPIDRATPGDLRRLRKMVRDWPRNGVIVTLCDCPEDATAVRAAHALQRLGFADARPLRGGHDAWLAAQGGAGRAPGPTSPSAAEARDTPEPGATGDPPPSAGLGDRER